MKVQAWVAERMKKPRAFWTTFTGSEKDPISISTSKI
jgi:hypothetical protein